MLYVLIVAVFVQAFAANAEAVSSKARSNYVLHCSGCHGLDGKGVPDGGVPGFPGSIGFIAGSDAGRAYILKVPGVINNRMDDAELTDVLNYILSISGEKSNLYFTVEEVSSYRLNSTGNVVTLRREIVRQLQSEGVQIADYPWP